MSREFFDELENFLPVFVSVIPSYIHAAAVFSVVVLIGSMISKKIQSTMDIDGDGEESPTEKKMKRFIYMGTSVIAGIFLADIAFTISWRLRNKVNRKHLVYSRWFPGIFKQ